MWYAPAPRGPQISAGRFDLARREVRGHAHPERDRKLVSRFRPVSECLDGFHSKRTRPRRLSQLSGRQRDCLEHLLGPGRERREYAAGVLSLKQESVYDADQVCPYPCGVEVQICGHVSLRRLAVILEYGDVEQETEGRRKRRVARQRLLKRPFGFLNVGIQR